MNAAMIVLATKSATGTEVGQEDLTYASLAGTPVISRTLQLIDEISLIATTVLVVDETDRGTANRLVSSLSLRKLGQVIVGGATRTDSEMAGLIALADEISAGRIDVIGFHEANRPFINEQVLSLTLERAERLGGAVPCSPLEGPVYRDGLSSEVEADDTRGEIVAVQAPQAFRAKEVFEAYRLAELERFSGQDPSQVVEHFGTCEIAIVPAYSKNIKLVTHDDMRFAELVVADWSRQHPDH